EGRAAVVSFASCVAALLFCASPALAAYGLVEDSQGTLRAIVSFGPVDYDAGADGANSSPPAVEVPSGIAPIDVPNLLPPSTADAAHESAHSTAFSDGQPAGAAILTLDHDPSGGVAWSALVIVQGPLGAQAADFGSVGAESSIGIITHAPGTAAGLDTLDKEPTASGWSPTSGPAPHAGLRASVDDGSGGVADSVVPRAPETIQGALRETELSAPDRSILAATLLVGAIPLVLAALYSRVAKDKALSNSTRAQIHARVRDAGATNAAALGRELALHVTTVLYHLRRLEREGYVRSRAAQGVTFWMLPEGALDVARLSCQRTPLAQSVASAVAVAPGATATELSESVGADFHAVYYHLQRLSKAGVVERRPVEDRIGWYPRSEPQSA
ncbi:MAG TPA: hypothetical protein VI565_02355, partial [Burkholderiales bacterium]|nr:hypothetical protein [Burkholderiales bacterium]